MELLAGTDLETIYTQSLYETAAGRTLPPPVAKFLASEWAREYGSRLRYDDIAETLAALDAGTMVATAHNMYLVDRILIHDGVDPAFYSKPECQEPFVRDGICVAYAILPPTSRERTYIRHEFSLVRSALREAVRFVDHFSVPEEERLKQKLASIGQCRDLSFL